MKRYCALLILALTVLPACNQAAQSQTSPPQSSLEVHFSPHGGCTDAIIREINAAQSSLLIQAYSFTSSPIAKALVDAHKRGVKVEVILDKSQEGEKYSSADFVQHAGISTLIDSRHQIAHNKVMILDSQVVITGSFNFTKSAEENNAENLLVIRDKGIAEKYTANWKVHADHSEAYKERTQGYSETHRTAMDKPEAAVTATGGFVASSNSKVFHKIDCKSASKISAKNVVRYGSRDEAIQAGKKPCAECNP